MDSILGKKINSTAIPSLLCDFYKTSHRIQYPRVLSFYIVHSHLVVIFMLHLLHVLYHLAFRHLF